MTEMNPKMALKFIKDAKKLGVTKGKLGTLEFELTDETTNQQTRAPRPAFKVSKKDIAAADQQVSVQSQYDDARDELSTLHVEDPAAFEQAMIDKELEDEPSSGEISFEEAQNI